MKKVFGLCILVFFFLVATGCTQSTPSAPATTTIATTAAVPEATIVMATAVPTGNTTPATTVEVNVTMDLGNMTAPSTGTLVETTVPQTPAPAQTPLVTAKVIHIRNNTFVPAVTTVLPGTGITWINDDAISHTVKATGVHEGMFNSGEIALGAQWGYTFGAAEGTFNYTDTKLLFNGTIIIQKAKTISDYTPAPTPTVA